MLRLARGKTNKRYLYTMKTAIVWLRQDLRLADNPALRYAAGKADRLLLVYIDDPLPETASQLGRASRAWLHHSLRSLQSSLERLDQKLYFFSAPSGGVLESLVEQTGASLVVWNRVYDPASCARDTLIKEALGKKTEVKSFNGLLLVEPWNGRKADDTAYRVFTPYWRKVSPGLCDVKPLGAPRKLPPAPRKVPESAMKLSRLELLPALDWHQGMLKYWQIGEVAAGDRCREFIAATVADYREQRDLPDVEGTSRLSPHLHFGEISPRQIIHKLYSAHHSVHEKNSGAETYAKEIVWREFAYHLLFHFPQTIEQPLDKRFDAFPWPKLSVTDLKRWQQGRTGVPIVDAGMRQLWQSGWMHNRVRMIVASFLVKNMLIPWQHGERWFRDTLVDADLASNVMGWQWAAGCGADAAPYFRVFNPVLQGEKFDTDGSYVRRWVPELAQVDKKFVHKPWELPADELAALGYPQPVADLKLSRQRALDAFAEIRKSPA